MKKITILWIFLSFFALQGVSAQQEIEWKKTPVNTLPVFYTKNHFNLKGDIKSEKIPGEWGYEYIFDQKGNLIWSKSDLLGDYQYFYDANGKLLKSVSNTDYGSITDLYTLDSKGRVIEWKYSDGSGGQKYTYNKNGLWEKTLDYVTGQLVNIKYYDSNNRIIKEEIYSSGSKSFLYEYSYASSGKYQTVTKTTTTLADNKVTTFTDYILDGNNLYSSSDVTLTYDIKGNWHQKLSNGNIYSTRELTYHDGTVSGKSSSVIPSTPPAPKPNTPVVANDCVSGDCQNGWGKKNFSYGYYEGFWKNGKRHGYGFFRWTGSGDYMGFWENDDLHGYGCYLGTKKNMIGEYKNGMLNGVAYTHDLENEKWEYGIFKNYLIDTPYTFYDNKITTGCIAGDCQNMYGRYKWSNGDMFTGFFKNGMMYMGTYTFASGDKYEGMFNNNNQYHGQGRFFFKDKSYYGGEWVNGQQHGLGYYYDSNYAKKIGEWSNGKLIKSYQ